ncbi:phosphodiester glycosidase family protein [Streptomyces sp. NPDC006393]|uniref:phosphodiester glycosidase family protein n=1 Tax=Streptomyces sp. NPDC006393 TaxID=3156763 RepID=UPI0033C22BEE
MTRTHRPWTAAAAALGAALALTSPANAEPSEPSLLAANWTKGTAVTVSAGVTRTTWTESTPDNRAKARILQVVEIDPTAGALTLESTVGRGDGITETVADQLATVSSVAARRPLVGVNGGLFKSDPKHPDHVLPADDEPKALVHLGVSATDGVLHSAGCWMNGAGSSGAVLQYGIPYITKLRAELSLTTSTGATVGLDDINRDPGRIRGCARDAEDAAVTDQKGLFTDPDEIVLFTDDYEYPVPKPGIDPLITADDDPGFEVVLDADGVVTDAHEGRGGRTAAEQVHVPAGGHILQGIGTGAQWLREHLVRDDRVTLGQKLHDVTLDRDIPLDDSVDVVSSFHQLLRNDAVPDELPNSCSGTATGADGTNPICTDSRTALGTNIKGHPVLITLTGQDTEDGDYLRTFATLLASPELALVDALNLDGGGSTTLMAVTKPLNALTPLTPPTDTVNGVKVYRHVADAVYSGVGGYGMYAK